MERRGITYEDLCESCSSAKVIAKIAAKFDIWEEASPHLGLIKNDITVIKRDINGEVKRRMATLNKWVERKGDEATYLNLMTACHELDNKQMIDLILDQLKEGIY